MRVGTLGAIVVLCGGLMGAQGSCGGSSGPSTVIEQGKGGAAAQCDPKTYPCGPYGTQVGSVIQNLSFPGRVNATAPVTTISLSDFYQNKKIQALAISATAWWCPPCNDEQPPAEKLYQGYQAEGDGVAFLEASIQKTDGSPADMTSTDAWRAKYNLTFDLVCDPTNVLQPYYNINAFPMNMVVRTSDMRIVWQFNGEDMAGLKNAIDQVLANP